MSATVQPSDVQTAASGSLMAGVAEVRGWLERAAGRSQNASVPEAPLDGPLAEVSATFGLSSFERNVLLLCAGIELDSSLAALCAEAQGDGTRTYPTFSLALAALPGAHWSALSPSAPLRYWRLIELAAGPGVTSSPLRINEWTLNVLTGVPHLEEQLAGYARPVTTPPLVAESHRELAEHIVAHLLACRDRLQLPLVQLCGPDAQAKSGIAALAGHQAGWEMHRLPAESIPAAPPEWEAFRRLWEREAAINQNVPLVDFESNGAADRPHLDAAQRFVESFRGPVFLACRQRLSIRERTAFPVDVERPSAAERKQLWKAVLGDSVVEAGPVLNTLATQFHAGAHTIHSTAEQALPASPVDLSERLWSACRVQSRPRLDELAQRVDSAATWDALVLPESQLQTLREMAAQTRHRGTVLDEWGFRGKDTRGLGVSALFAGPSGTGKTMASEVVANELRLDLYRVDLSQVVSKYIGETEKNLKRVFDAAEEGGVVLLFDEADALFGKRSEVKDSHDRYANIEVSYLLQRMECYNGLAILSTNLKSALDTAFLRRLRFIVQFPFPDQAQRLDIWKRVFPPGTPVDALQMDKLAKLNIAGGNIRNIALSAAFLAADAGTPVSMAHLARAARAECSKLERPISETEIGQW